MGKGIIRASVMAVATLAAASAVALTVSKPDTGKTQVYGPLRESDEVIKPLPPEYETEAAPDNKGVEPLRADIIRTDKWKKRGITKDSSENIFLKDNDTYICANQDCSVARKLPERRD
ncbi:hypothetical protein OVA03_10380 [Asticcacaulis sp. SL142]|uniref:hypothetical protein n=1 Tax=Asticcacaulis sp. SL142 TaxID=2995155 RepID=UPI00226CA6D5|nr:hypothetical protein [Asticcacaulis sp. SL142]WAC47114.1 hypothetical protein OVA03_10380 [Asticcacaulis sp. SL142]